jgi:cysteinyl-tRNA synthetase
MTPELSIVIPLYNEAENIEPLYAELSAALNAIGRPYEVIVVDDGSRDDSFARLKAVHARDARWRIIRFRRNFGQTAGFAAGFAPARGAVYGEGGYRYFDVTKAPGYGIFSGASLGAAEAAERTGPAVHRHKRRPEDFTLWLPAEAGREFRWESPWGPGWPGWHIECAAMSLRYLGPEFDLHVGGSDLRFPHHENSRAVAMTATGKRFAGCWLHAAHLLVEGRKMSKSAGNEYTLDDLAGAPRPGGEGYAPADFRYYCLTLHHSSPMNFTWEGQEAAARARSRLRSAFRRAASRATSGRDAGKEAGARFRAAVSDDLNMPRALSVVRKAVSSGIGGETVRSLAAEWDAVLGVGLLSGDDAAAEVPGAGGSEAAGIPGEVAEMARRRDALRAAGDYAGADALRERIRAAGYDVADTGTSPGRLRKR